MPSVHGYKIIPFALPSDGETQLSHSNAFAMKQMDYFRLLQWWSQIGMFLTQCWELLHQSTTCSDVTLPHSGLSLGLSNTLTCELWRIDIIWICTAPCAQATQNICVWNSVTGQVTQIRKTWTSCSVVLGYSYHRATLSCVIFVY